MNVEVYSRVGRRVADLVQDHLFYDFDPAFPRLKNAQVAVFSHCFLCKPHEGPRRKSVVPVVLRGILLAVTFKSHIIIDTFKLMENRDEFTGVRR